ncbi:probable calcium-binding protein CML46 [Miscanthus floridulus]|uniref:probable calcium-binding protein CML46 n=1 Tax=Miscanthus floridulus TaxID=154761 RepID=UPI003457E1AF
MAERTNAMAAPRPLLRRMLSFREPLLVIPYLLSFLGAAASALARSHSSLLHSLARALFPPNAKHAAHAPSSAAAPRPDDSDGEDEDAALSKAEVEAIMATIGLAAVGRGEGLAAAMGLDDVRGLFDAEEPSFAEVRAVFAVFDADRDGFIGAEDLQGPLARLGIRQDAAACRAMVVAAGGGRDARMNLFQFVRFLENGLC